MIYDVFLFFFRFIFIRFRIEGFLGYLTSRVISRSKLDVVDEFKSNLSLFFFIEMLHKMKPQKNNEKIYETMNFNKIIFVFSLL